MFEIDPTLLDEIAQGEVDAIREGLNDPEMRKDPRFLEKVRKFLKDNNLLVSPRCKGIADIKKQMATHPIPVFEELKDGINIDNY